MPHLAYYDRSTGEILGVWSSAEAVLLEANRRTDDPTRGYVLFAEPEPSVVQTQYEIREDQLVPKVEVRLTATPATFAADGVTACQISLEPFVPCTLVVEQQGRETLVELAQADDPLLLTADAPQHVTLRLRPRPGYCAQPLTVEAT
jgi:hypothetical protein